MQIDHKAKRFACYVCAAVSPVKTPSTQPLCGPWTLTGSSRSRGIVSPHPSVPSSLSGGSTTLLWSGLSLLFAVVIKSAINIIPTHTTDSKLRHCNVINVSFIRYVQLPGSRLSLALYSSKTRQEFIADDVHCVPKNVQLFIFQITLSKINQF